jgi:uncharacterized protein (DUF1330 family)
VTSPIYIVASLWIQEGDLAAFEAYERKAASIMKRCGGFIERTVRPSSLGAGPDQPFEVHLVRFPSDEMFERYRTDAELESLSSEREAVITKTLVLIGSEGPAYAT